MLGFLEQGRAAAAARAAVELLHSGDVRRAFACLDSAGEALGPRPFVVATELLLANDELDIAAVLSAGALLNDPHDWNALAVAVEVAWRLGHRHRVVHLLRQMHLQDPTHLAVGRNLVSALVSINEPVRAIRILDRLAADEPSLEAARGEVLLILGDLEGSERHLRRALGLLQQRRCLSALQPREWRAVQGEIEQVGQVHREVLARLHGLEDVSGLAPGIGWLTGHACVSRAMLGRQAMRDSPRIAARLRLESPARDDEEGAQLLGTDGGDPRGACLLGISELRQGQPTAAERWFRRALRRDATFFPGLLGLGAALDHQRHDLPRKVRELPAEPEPPWLREVVPDYDRLGELERRVVLASVHPVRSGLPRLARRAATVRILPLDVRTADLPGLSGRGGTGGDLACPDAPTALAAGGQAYARVEGLLDIDTDGAWAFAHELLHLVHEALGPELRPHVVRLYARARSDGHVLEQSQLRGDHEFLAVAYTDYLALRYGLSSRKVDPLSGSLGEINAFFDRVAALDDIDTPVRRRVWL